MACSCLVSTCCPEKLQASASITYLGASLKRGSAAPRPAWELLQPLHCSSVPAWSLGLHLGLFRQLALQLWKKGSMHFGRQTFRCRPACSIAQEGSGLYLDGLRCYAKGSMNTSLHELIVHTFMQREAVHPAGPGIVCCLGEPGAERPSGQAAMPMRHQGSMAAGWRGPDEMLAPLNGQTWQVATVPSS